MIVALPRDPQGMNGMLAETYFNRYAKWMGSLQPREGHVELPRFKAKSSINLANVLESTGMTCVLKQNQIYQQGIVEVQETGTVAVALTEIDMTLTTAVHSAPPRPFSFIADHPFVFFIVDNPTGVILFMGVIYHPEELK